MHSLKNRLVLQQRADNSLVLYHNPTRRILFGVVAVVMLIAFFSAVDYERDFSAEHFFSTLLYFSLVSSCLIFAGWDNRKIFEQADDGLYFERKVFRLTISREFVHFDEVTEMVLSRVDSSSVENSFAGAEFRGSGAPPQILKRDIELYRLTIGTERRRFRLEDSSNKQELQQLGSLIAQYMEVPFFVDTG